MSKGTPKPTDIDEKIISHRRRNASQTKPKEKSERPVNERPERSSRNAAGPSQPQRMSPNRQHAAPQVIIQRPPPEADPEDFSRRLHISNHSSPRPAQSSSKSNTHHKLFNPDRDPIPTMRRTAEPDSISDTASNGRPARDPEAPTRQLYDYRKDNSVRLNPLARANQPNQRPVPTPKNSGGNISASSTSSYAASQVSSTFTLSSTTDGSSASSALFDRSDRTQDSGTNVFALQLKKLYREITSMEMKIQKEETDEEQDGRDRSRVLLRGGNAQPEEDEGEKEREKWTRRRKEHEKLSETIRHLLEVSLAPSVPASLRNIPTKYNIMVRLWTFGFHKLLEDLRRASMTSSLALEHLQSFIYYAYTFYTSLLETHSLAQFKSSWLEALGDLARYRMMVATMINGSTGPSYAAMTASDAAGYPEVSTNGQLVVPTDSGTKSVSNAAAARIDDSPSPSVGVAAARAIELPPEVEQWRSLARDWYGKGLTEQPGTGRLHQHLGMLSREVRGEELRAVYHFVKSMTTLHPFSLSRESILSIWTPEAQARRRQPETRLPDLFVFLHGMLFTNIQLDDFRPSLFRFIERLELEGAEERVWTMMAVVNISAILEYNKPASVIKRCGGISSRESGAPVRLIAKKDTAKEDDKMDVDDEKPSVLSPPASDGESEAMEHSMAFKLALELTFSMLSFALRHPHRKASPFAKSRLNPYLTVILTFLATLLKHDKTREVMERSIPWEELAVFFATIPRSIMHSERLMETEPLAHVPEGTDRWMMLTTSCAPPLPEDWCLRGMEWVGRKVFERGYWKSGDDRQAEIEVLDETEVEEMDDGRIEDDGEVESNLTMKKRYIRIVRSAVTLAGTVPGFRWVEGTREWRVEGELAEKVQRWKEEERREKEEEERRKLGTRWADDPMDVDEDGWEELLDSSSEDDDDLPPEIRELKERRKQLQSLLRSSQIDADRSRVRRSSAKERRTQQTLPMQPGYTVLVVDTNVLLSALSMFCSLVESLRWTVLVPLPVIMELDGLKTNSSAQLSEAANNALNYITSHIRSHSTSLKVQTSKGNYLTSLNVRTEEVDFASGRAERSMDDLILKTAIWHDEHWTDRSAMLKSDTSQKVADPAKVVLLSLDRNLRLKARSRQLPAAGEKDLGHLLSDGK
ncbi:hypothetical protein V5O48_009328 [Marasmius crinis-equi]|uniref:PIN domain-containing protein n=1 Tax=Marasmius crinis-equi TaxID=585013 RepID=A0ABR3FC31_9AGAR